MASESVCMCVRVRVYAHVVVIVCECLVYVCNMHIWMWIVDDNDGNRNKCDKNDFVMLLTIRTTVKHFILPCIDVVQPRQKSVQYGKSNNIFISD